MTQGGEPDFFEWWAESEGQLAHIYRKRRWPGPEYWTGCLIAFTPRIRSVAKQFRCHDCVDWMCTLHYPDECMESGCEWCEHANSCMSLIRIEGFSTTVFERSK
jgi:hypothetical protein